MALYEINPTNMRGSGTFFKGRAGEALGRCALVYKHANGAWYLADADVVAEMPVIGLTMERVLAGQIVRILSAGFIGRSTWTWTPGGRIYASSTPGALTQTPPPTAEITQTVGMATSPVLMKFNSDMGNPVESELAWDYLVKRTNNRWVAKNAFGLELDQTPTNTSLEDLINTCVTDKGSDPGIIKVSTRGVDFNIDDPIQLSDHTVLEFIWPWNTAEIFLEANSDCDMIQPLANTVADVIIRNVRLNGNKTNNAGNIDGISWEIGTPAGGGMEDAYP